MKPTVIDITTVLSPELKSRFAVKDLFLFIQNTGSRYVTVDFSGVKFATRSFIDEYYNTIVKGGATSSIRIETINIPEDIQMIFTAVERTQNKTKSARSKSGVIKCRTFVDVQRVFSELPL